jgi:plasmid stabilization system protein ParE
MLRRDVLLSPKAEHDLIEIAAWYESQGGVDLAESFVHAAQKLFEKLARSPEIGWKRNFRSHRLAGARLFALAKPFSVYLAFYRPGPNEVVILRVLHGMRDLAPLLEGRA